MSMLKNEIPAAFKKHGPLTNEGLRKAIPGASRSGLHRMLETMRTAKGVYITGYTKSDGVTGGAQVPIYALGDYPDAASPETQRDRLKASKLRTLERRKEKESRPTPIKVEKIKPELKDTGRPVVLRIAIKPLVTPAPMRVRHQPAGMWSGLMA